MTELWSRAHVEGLGTGEHVCALYTQHQERDAMLLAFFRAGLRRAQKCVAALTDPDPVVQGLGSEAAVDGWLTSGQLRVYRTADTVTAPDRPRTTGRSRA